MVSELPLEAVHPNTNLNPRFTLSSFVVGPFNELAHAAAQAVIRKPGIAYNPLFIYGPTGLGKTHLIQAVGNHFRQSADRKVYYVTTEKFSMDYVSASRRARCKVSKKNTGSTTCSSWTTCSFWPAATKSKKNFFISSIFSTTTTNN